MGEPREETMPVDDLKGLTLDKTQNRLMNIPLS